MSTVDTRSSTDKELPLRAGLWLAQMLLAGVYVLAGTATFIVPASQGFVTAPWAGHMSEALLMFFGVVELAAGVGIVLPSLMRVAPELTVIAAVCSAVLQLFVIVFFVFLGTPGVMFPLDASVLALSVFVAWGRSDRASIAPGWRVRQVPTLGGEPSLKRSRQRVEIREREATRSRESGHACC